MNYNLPLSHLTNFCVSVKKRLGEQAPVIK